MTDLQKSPLFSLQLQLWIVKCNSNVYEDVKLYTRKYSTVGFNLRFVFVPTEAPRLAHEMFKAIKPGLSAYADDPDKVQ